MIQFPPSLLPPSSPPLQIFATRMGKDVLEAQGVHKCKPLLISILLILLFLSRATYNFVALSERTMEPYGYGWKGWTVVTDTQVGSMCVSVCVCVMVLSR